MPLTQALSHEATRSMSRGGREVVAESIAYAVCSLAGLEMELGQNDKALAGHDRTSLKPHRNA